MPGCGPAPQRPRHDGKVADIKVAQLLRRLREIAAEHIRWGRRMS